MLGDLGDYLREPEETEKKLLAKECFNRRHTLGEEVRVQAEAPRPMGVAQAGNARRGQDQCCNGIGVQAGQMVP